MNLFTKSCACGGMILGPRVGGKARGEWLGHDKCPDCRDHEKQSQGSTASVEQTAVTNHGDR